ncbi:MAG TPA: hypothetical protein DHM90_15135, partial [Clostridiaceae bacterium]|nr:hypothetical protein [Clostridiaceae bacterium]
PNEIKTYLRGGYGKSPAPIDDEIVKMILGDEKIEAPREISSLSPVFDEAKKEMEEKLGRPAKDEEVLSYIMNPQQAILKPKTEVQDKKTAPEASKKAASNEVIEFEMIIERQVR